MKRAVVIVMLITFTLLVDYTSIYAYDTLPYWYSDSDKIGWYTDNTDGSLQTSNFSSSIWETLSMHEFGHAIGYIGHTTTG